MRNALKIIFFGIYFMVALSVTIDGFETSTGLGIFAVIMFGLLGALFLWVLFRKR